MKTNLGSHRLGVSLAVVILAWAASTARAQFTIDWSTIDGGGGTSTGGVYSVSGTIGQPDAGQMSGGRYSMAGGFWGIVGAIQTPGAAPLTITHSHGMATVSWPFPSPGFGLEVTSSLSPPRRWIPVLLPYQSNAERIWVTVPAAVGNQFFRLHKP